mgnify:CR=1 FL=1
MSLFITYYNHPYYIRQMERRGYGKEVDWIECRIKIPDAPVELVLPPTAPLPGEVQPTALPSAPYEQAMQP